ncbi:hypothetical protein ScPMuIL_012043 [Solemya velum]
MESSIPVIDFSVYRLQIDDEKTVKIDDLKAIADELLSALGGVGFFYIKNHGFPSDLVASLRRITREFFEQPEAVKCQYARQVATNNGWVATGRESLNPMRPGDYKEAYNYMPNETGQKWPEFLPDFVPLHTKFFTQAKKLTERLLDVLSISLGLKDRTFMRNCHRLMGHPGNCTAIRSLYYPPVTKPLEKEQIRLGEHSDYGTVTLLFQDDVGGLQVQTKDGNFVEVPPIPDTIVVNTGDLLQRWTSDAIIAAKHRVLIPEEERKKELPRQSFAFFVHPDDEVMIECLDGSNKYEPVTGKGYLDMRFAVTY